MSGQIRYSEEFEIDAVAQVTEHGYSVKEVAERLGVSTKSLYTWMAQFSKPQRQTDQEAEVRRLRKELVRVTEERDILKKGETIFRHWSEDNGRTAKRICPSRDAWRTCMPLDHPTIRSSPDRPGGRERQTDAPSKGPASVHSRPGPTNR